MYMFRYEMRYIKVVAIEYWQPTLTANIYREKKSHEDFWAINTPEDILSAVFS